jgi:SAM-dependent methyltransferase
MTRHEEILKYVGKSDLGIEIAPWFNPLAAKQDGYNIKILDVYPTDELLRRAKADPNIPDETIPRIESVDFVGSAVEIFDLVSATTPGRTFDYIISSHNFEHLPNPIKFLQGCEKLLKTGGMLSMAIPDYRACFDHFRWPSTIADWLAAYQEDRAKPRLEQTFAQRALSCLLREPPGREGAFYVDDNPDFMIPDQNLREAYAGWLAAQASGNADYTDTHCSVVTATSFRLLILECRFLRLTNLAIKETSGPSGCEFFVHLENQPPNTESPNSIESFYKQRAKLMHQVANEAGQCTAWGWGQLHGATQSTTPKNVSLEKQIQQLSEQIVTLNHTLATRRPSLIEKLRALTGR